MKNLHLFLAFIFSVSAFSQSFQESIQISGGLPPSENVAGISIAEYNTLTGNTGDWSKIMGVFYEFDDIRFAKVGTDGTFLLFDEWENFGDITVGERKYRIVKANFHVQREELMTKLDNDSIFLFDLNTLDEFSINNRKFKQLQNSKDGSFGVYEVIHDADRIKLLKKHTADMQEASPNPMLNRSRNKIIKKESYFVSVDGLIESFNLRKSDYLDLVDKDKQKEFNSQVKEHKLNYKEESDAPRIIALIASGKSSAVEKDRVKDFN